MSLSPKIRVFLAPALAVDRSTSMDLYLSDIQKSLTPFADRVDFEVVVPPSAPGDSWFTKQWARYVGYPRLLREKLTTYPAAVLHVLDHSYGHLCRRDRLTVLTCHGLENFQLKLKHIWQQALWVYRVRGMKRARRIVVISEDIGADAQRFVGIDPAKIQLVYYGMEPVFDASGPVEPALAAQRAAGSLLILHVGTNILRKNIGRLLEAIAQLRREGVSARFVKVGADPRQEGYLDQMRSLDLLEHFDYLGWRDTPSLAAVYRSCDVLAFPSIHEGFGRPIIEAQACRLPVVVADTASAREIGGDGTFRHVPTDVGDLAAKLRAALLEPTTRATVIERGRLNTRRFDWAAHAQALVDIYSELHAAQSASH